MGAGRSWAGGEKSFAGVTPPGAGAGKAVALRTASRRSGATATSLVAALKAEPLTRSTGAPTGWAAWNATVNIMASAAMRASRVEES